MCGMDHITGHGGSAVHRSVYGWTNHTTTITGHGGSAVHRSVYGWVELLPSSVRPRTQRAMSWWVLSLACSWDSLLRMSSS